MHDNYDLNVAETDHIEWMLTSGILLPSDTFELCDRLQLPRRSNMPSPEDVRRTSPIQTPAPAHEVPLSWEPPLPGGEAFKSPNAKPGGPEHFDISTGQPEPALRASGPAMTEAPSPVTNPQPTPTLDDC